MRTPHPRLVLLGVTCAVVSMVTSQAVAWDTNPLSTVVVRQHHRCGADDLPERGLQGSVPKADQDSGRAEKGYNCGLTLLGYTALDGDGRPNENANMAWAGHCAYISSSSGVSIAPQGKPSPPATAGVAVVSVSDAGVPKQVGVLRSPGAMATAETLHAVTTPSGRSILVVGQYGNDVVSDPKPMDVYDISNPDCSRYRHIPNPQFPRDRSKATFYWPENIHNLTISGNGKYVFATLPLQVADISGLWGTHPHVTYVGDIEKAMAGTPVATGPMADLDDALPEEVRSQTHPLNTSHEAWPSADGTTVYVGGSTAEFETFSIVDIGSWLQRDASGNPKAPPRVVSQVSGRGHSVRTATIGGKRYALHSEEGVFGAAYGCIPQEGAPFVGPAQPWLTDISDPAHPRTVSQFGLEINEPENCTTQMNDGENNSVHYHDVDDAKDTTFVMASMWNSGIRVFDVRDPQRPAEVAYFNPGDVDPTAGVTLDHAWGHVRYIARTGQIWFATADGGFWVTRLEGGVRAYLGLDAKNRRMGLPALHIPADDPGRPGTAGVRLTRPLYGYVDLSRYYCTLGATTPSVVPEILRQG